MKAVIMVGGLGTRLRPLTEVLPKPLLPLLDNKTIIDIIISKLKAHNFDEIYLATNYMANTFEEYLGDGSKFGVKLFYSKEKTRLGTAGPLRLIKNYLNEDFLVINGDIITNLNFSELREFHLENDSYLTLTTKKIITPLEYGLVLSDKGIVREIKEKPNLEHEIIAGIYMLNPKALDFIPPNINYNMTELINALLSNKKTVLNYELKEYWLDVGQRDNYERAQKDISSGKINHER